ncbi:hypothetical protein ACFXJ5_26685 [Streptomyces sp. NPDC059373]
MNANEERHDRPLADCLEDFWDCADDLPRERDPGPPDPAPGRLGPSGITVRGRDLAAVLRPAYDAFTRRADGSSD